MTRGHFHLDSTRGEVCLCLRGEGLLLLMDQDRKTNSQPMTPGSIHLINGKLAHRVVNTGQEPLIFYCTWMSDCGHDYLSIQRDGFGLRVFRSNGCPELRAA
jgi:glucose-6-phosphate isomerase